MIHMSEVDAFLEKYDTNHSFRSLVSSIDWLNITNNTKEYLEVRLPEIGELFNKVSEDLERLKNELFTKWSTESGLAFSIQVAEGEWFYYADAKDTPVCIIKGKGFRYIKGKIVNMPFNNGWTVSKTIDDSKYIVSNRILPLSKVTKE